MIIIESLKKFGKKLYDIYFAIGAVAMAILAASVVFTVIARYFFKLSWKEVSEFNVTLFAFTTFWGLGVNVINDEHVIIDIVYDGLKAPVKRVMSVINYIIVLIVDVVFTYQGFLYTAKMGGQLSMGMEIPMRYMYGIMPVSGVLCAICIVVKILIFITADDAFFAPKNVTVSEDDE